MQAVPTRRKPIRAYTRATSSLAAVEEHQIVAGLQGMAGQCRADRGAEPPAASRGKGGHAHDLGDAEGRLEAHPEPALPRHGVAITASALCPPRRLARPRRARPGLSVRRRWSQRRRAPGSAVWAPGSAEWAPLKAIVATAALCAYRWAKLSASGEQKLNVGGGQRRCQRRGIGQAFGIENHEWRQEHRRDRPPGPRRADSA